MEIILRGKPFLSYFGGKEGIHHNFGDAEHMTSDIFI
jgi:hypothetical protein